MAQIRNGRESLMLSDFESLEITIIFNQLQKKVFSFLLSSTIAQYGIS